MKTEPLPPEARGTLLEGLLRAQSDLGEGIAIVDGERFVHANEAWARILAAPSRGCS